jgi:hypothetical protein
MNFIFQLLQFIFWYFIVHIYCIFILANQTFNHIAMHKIQFLGLRISLTFSLFWSDFPMMLVLRFRLWFIDYSRYYLFEIQSGLWSHVLFTDNLINNTEYLLIGELFLLMPSMCFWLFPLFLLWINSNSFNLNYVWLWNCLFLLFQVG